MTAIHLQPAVFTHDELDAFQAAGLTTSCAVSPRANRLAVFTAPASAGVRKRDTFAVDNDIQVAAWDRAPSLSRRSFIVDTYVTFMKFTKEMARLQQNESTSLQDETIVTFFSNIADDHLVALSSHIETLAKRDPPTAKSIGHYQSLYSTFNLLQTVYFPASGSRRGLVGEELLDWLNRNFIAPSTEEGVALTGIDEPWSDPNFWPYITKCVLRGLSRSAVHFLAQLETHTSPYLQHIASLLVPLITNHPRSTQFAMDSDFFHSWRQWKEKVALLRREVNAAPPREGSGDWRESVSDIVGVLEGNPDVIMKLCKDSEAGWREAICVWGVWVRVGLRRDDLTDLVKQTVDDLPPDPTELEDMLHVALLQGSMGKVIDLANKMDIWLAAHMTDMLEPLGMLDEPNPDAPGTVRDYLLLAYAEYLRADPALWRQAVDYMCACGDTGKRMADQVLLLVLPQDLKARQAGDSEVAETGVTPQDKDAAVVQTVQALSEVCKEHNREHVRRAVCKIAARDFMRHGNYGLAISHFVSAGDFLGVGRAANALLDEFIEQGASEFVGQVRQIPTGLPTPESVSEGGIFLRRVLFVQRYAEFHQLCSDGDLAAAADHLVDMFGMEIVPRSWWAVLLADAAEILASGQLIFRAEEVCELLGRLETISSLVTQGYVNDYLGVLMKICKVEDEKHVHKRLHIIHLALARYYARCGSIGVGGRGPLVEAWSPS